MLKSPEKNSYTLNISKKAACSRIMRISDRLLDQISKNTYSYGDVKWTLTGEQEELE
jgi:hypothetical protein